MAPTLTPSRYRGLPLAVQGEVDAWLAAHRLGPGDVADATWVGDRVRVTVYMRDADGKRYSIGHQAATQVLELGPPLPPREAFAEGDTPSRDR